jgi:hypothetical protein
VNQARNQRRHKRAALRERAVGVNPHRERLPYRVALKKMLALFAR